MEENDGIDVDSLAARKEDQLILYHAILGHELTEVYSNARLKLAGDRHIVRQLVGAAACKQYGLAPGQAMNIKNGFDFDLAVDRKTAWDSIVRDKPKLVIGSPPCTFFSRLQELNKHMYRNDAAWMAQFQDSFEQAKRYVRCCAKIYKHQREAGRYFFHKHPWLATSWFLPEVAKIMRFDDVQRVRTDMCQFGMTSRTGGVGSVLEQVWNPRDSSQTAATLQTH